MSAAALAFLRAVAIAFICFSMASKTFISGFAALRPRFLPCTLFFDPGLRPLFLGSEAAAGGVATALVTAFGLRAILFFIV
ncbi:MAG: hypothetical protein ACK5FT_08980 [Sphingomonadales bacterium]